MGNVSKKIPPKFNGNIDSLNRIIQTIYDDINEVINATNKSENINRELSKGKPGNMRVVNYQSSNSESNLYRLEVYTEDGWAKSTLSLIDEDD